MTQEEKEEGGGMRWEGGKGRAGQKEGGRERDREGRRGGKGGRKGGKE